MSFKHPEFLYFLFAILIPIIIHLFNFRRYKKLWFSNIQFLKNITTETRKQNKLKHIIVLVLRVLAIFFIVIAFSGPQLDKNETASTSSNSIVAVYIDNSFSMMSDGRQGRLFEKSLMYARNIVEQLPRDKQILLITNESTSGRRLLSKEAFAAELNTVKISPDNRKMSSAIRSIDRIKEEKDFKETEMYLFSDFQRNIFDPVNFPVDTIGVYNFVPQQIRQKRNIYIDSCWVSAPVLLIERPIELNIRLMNVSETDIEKIPLRVLVKGQQKAVAGVDIAAGGSEIVTTNFTLYQKGWHTGSIEIDDHPIIFDDKLYFTFNIQDQVNVLEITSEDDNDLIRSFYETESLFNFHTMDYRQVDYNRFNEFNLIIMNNLPDLSTGLISQLNDFVASGKNVMFIPGRNIAPAKTDEFLGLFNAGKISSFDSVSTRVAHINLQSEMFREAIGKVPDNADLPMVFGHFKYNYRVSNGLTSLLTLLNGADFLLQKNYKNGMVYLMAAPLNEAYSNFYSNALFVPVMYNAAIQGVSSNRLFFIIGEDNIIDSDMPGMPYNEKPFVIKQDETDFALIPEQRINSGKLTIDLHGGIHNSGFYNLVLNDTVFEVFAFNYNRSESDMDFLDEEQLTEGLVTSGLKFFKVINTTENSLTTVIKSLQKENELWKLFIIFALFMLLAEILILRFWK